MNQAILAYQQRCWKNYKSDLELPENYTYLYGNPVKVHVPIDVATEGLMIVGAYPTALFNTIGKHRDVPVTDHLYPFSNDTYFDGSRVRQVRSGEELEEFYLKKLDYPRSKCWITDLVKVFLFKDGHIAKYYDLDFTGFIANRKDFMILAKSEKNMKYLFDEIELASPKVILLLSEEVTSVVMNVNRNEANKLLKSGINEISVRGKIYKVLACPHPGILMRGGEAGEKWRRVSENQLTLLQKILT